MISDKLYKHMFIIKIYEQDIHSLLTTFYKKKFISNKFEQRLMPHKGRYSKFVIKMIYLPC